MTIEDKKTRLATLTKQAAAMTFVPHGLKLTISNLQVDLGLAKCNLDGDCLSCGS